MNLLAPLFTKIAFLFGRPKGILVFGRGRDSAASAIFEVLGAQGKVKKRDCMRIGFFDVLGCDALILPCHEERISQAQWETFSSLARHFSSLVLVGTHLREPSVDTVVFAGEKPNAESLSLLARNVPPQTIYVFNTDDEALAELKSKIGSPCRSFGFGEDAEFRGSDTVIVETPELGTNFKINHKGKIVPIWLRGLFGKEYIYAALAAAATATEFGLNLVEVSQALSRWRGIEGRLRLVPGVNNTILLDDSASIDLFSLAESIDVLGTLGAKRRRIAVVGDIALVGISPVEAYELLGERLSGLSIVGQEGAMLLFTIGSGAKSLAEQAQGRGLEKENIFSFEEVEGAIKRLKEELREGDIVLVAGSMQMRMDLITEALRAG